MDRHKRYRGAVFGLRIQIGTQAHPLKEVRHGIATQRACRLHFLIERRSIKKRPFYLISGKKRICIGGGKVFGGRSLEQRIVFVVCCHEFIHYRQEFFDVFNAGARFRGVFHFKRCNQARAIDHHLDNLTQIAFISACFGNQRHKAAQR